MHQVVFHYAERRIKFIRKDSSRLCGPGSVVGIATGYGLDGPGIESRWWARFCAPVEIDPGPHPASCTVVTGYFPTLNGRSVTLTTHQVKDSVELFLHATAKFTACYIVNFTTLKMST